jgi:hypothetical protein
MGWQGCPEKETFAVPAEKGYVSKANHQESQNKRRKYHVEPSFINDRPAFSVGWI